MRIKLCGMTREADARLARQAGADLLGAVLVPDSPRAVAPAQAARLGRAGALPLVVVVADLSARELLEVARVSGARAIQLHGAEPPELLETLRAEGDWELWKAIRVRSPEEILDGVRRYGPVADLLLLDGWHPSKLGGTGTSFPWDALEALRPQMPAGLRLGIAGGLGPENVAEAVRRLGPDVVDVSSGVERRPGEKDREKVRAFVAGARRAAEASRQHESTQR